MTKEQGMKKQISKVKRITKKLKQIITLSDVEITNLKKLNLGNVV